MKLLTSFKTFFCIITLILVAPALSMAQPPDPGNDPFNAPVNGGVAVVAVIAFVYGAFRIYQLNKRGNAKNIDK